jgi:hypothetical protein
VTKPTGPLIGWVVLFFLVIGVALYLTMQNRTRPSVFVPPEIWRDVFTGDEPRKKFDI